MENELKEGSAAAHTMKHHATHLAGFELDHPIGHSGGICDSIEKVDALSASPVALIMVGSIYDVPSSLNDKITSRGLDYYHENIAKMADIAHRANKPLAVSVAGFSTEAYSSAVDSVVDAADIIEVNLGFPVDDWDEGQQRFTKPGGIENIKPIVMSVKEHAPNTPIGVKLPRYSDPRDLEKVADIIRGLDVQYVAVPGLAQLKELRERLPATIQCVGVESGPDLLDYLKVGAATIQVAGSYWKGKGNPSVFSDILSQYVDDLDQ